jgi:hypothetical protein
LYFTWFTPEGLDILNVELVTLVKKVLEAVNCSTLYPLVSVLRVILETVNGVTGSFLRFVKCAACPAKSELGVPCKQAKI